MKKMIISCTVFALIATTVVADAPKAASNKVGYVSSMAVINESKIGKKIRGELDAKFKASGMEVQKREQEITKALNDYKTRESTLSDSAKEAEQTKLMKMRRDFEAMVQEKDEELKRLQQKYNDQLTKEALQVAVELGKSKGLESVIDTDTGKVLYVASNVDYSAEFTSLMNKHFDAEHTKKAEPAKKAAVA
jgi:outer membrane protein